ncbi:hypothetical protein LMG31841_02974 [Paraburkholderia saeva]|uniref:Cupin type-2 domain-containing protein n=1 Tax=Paraburkholderia saeva TaxID=2777537 RepID=A0A9N8RY32_9BURK|nr:hypothetical protein LMG31841_02974 [Paraburkholderia saeva]CAG4925697.1 hypothetical protein R70241_05398 [Paraburkholderia saeva]
MSDAIQGTIRSQSVVKVTPDREIATQQRLPYFVGLSAQSAGTRGLSMYLIAVPPGGHAEPHSHRGYETGIYVLEGTVETRYGPGLRESVITEAGDFLFIPPGRAASAVQPERDGARASDRRAHARRRSGAGCAVRSLGR